MAMKYMTKKYMTKVALGASIAMTGLLSVPPAIAAVATPAAQHPHTRVAANTFGTDSYSGDFAFYQCDGDFHPPQSGSFPVEFASSDCSVRVWLKEGESGGWAYCISPGTTSWTGVPIKFDNPGIIQVTHNTSHC